MARYGYACVSPIDQDLRLQEAALRAAGCDVVRAEKASGTAREGRAELALLLAFLRPGDTLAVTRIDRLARSIGDLQDIVATLKQRGATPLPVPQVADPGCAIGCGRLRCLRIVRPNEPKIAVVLHRIDLAQSMAMGDPSVLSRTIRLGSRVNCQRTGSLWNLSI